MRKVLGLVSIGLFFGAVAVYGWMSWPRATGDVAGIESELSSTTTTTGPAGSSTVGPDQQPAPTWTANERSLLTDLPVATGPYPVRLVVDELGVDAPVQPHGVDSDGRMDVPNNIDDVGWYRFGPSPGDPGSAVLAAHVDLAGPGRGVFYDLGELEPGDEVEVRYDDETTARFVVTARAVYEKTELPLDVIFSREGPPVLTLVTCGGEFSRSARSYDSNVVVYAVPVDGAGLAPASSRSGGLA
ncbi:MAG TPA: class F sortase [Acidimicrobiia bacterium]